MKNAICSRLWEVEAVRDGRLSGEALTAHEEHVARCRECEHERRTLALLGEALRASTSAADEVALRRTRRAVLQRADEAWHAPQRSRRVRWVACAIAASVAGLTLAWFGLHEGGPPRDAVTVSASPGAQWRRIADQTFERIALSEGEFEVIVERRDDDRLVRVSVPEGEIEDMGTAFSVTVRAGRTQEIRVHEGSIIFHRRGVRDARVWTGEAWHAFVTPPMPQASANPQTTGTGPADAATATEQTATGPSSAASTTAAASTQTSTQTGANTNSATSAPAVPRALHAARVTRRDGSHDNYREDASYLRILSLVREGRIKEARSAAVAYGKQFPRGFRRAEVDRILERTSDGR